jgi:hypothetical protein
MASVYYQYGASIGGSSGGAQAAAAVALASGSASQSFTFSSTIIGTFVLIVGAVQNTVDATPIFLQSVVTAVSSTGFTVLFNVAPDTANYNLPYVVVPTI